MKLKLTKTAFVNVLLIIVVILLFFLIIAYPGKAGFSVGDNPELIMSADQTQLTVRAYIAETVPVSSVEARIILYRDWVQLDQEYIGVYSKIINISSLVNGEYKIQTRYYNSSGSPAEQIWGAQKSFTINRPTPAIVYGSVTITSRDTNNNPLTNVQVIPSYNVTNSNGIVTIGNLPLNINTNFTLSKSGYNTTYFDMVFSSGTTISKSITMGKIGGDKREFDVIGYTNMVAGRGTFILVKDRGTGERLDNANVVIYDGSNVKSLPGSTVNGRVFMSIPTESQAGQYLIEVTKSGYDDFSDGFTVWAAPPTPIPTITPTPIPTPTPTPDPATVKKFRPEVSNGLELTDDEYREWQVIQAQKKEAENATTAITPPQKETFPWSLVLLLAGGVGVVAFKKYGHRLPIKKIWGNRSDNTERVRIFTDEEGDYYPQAASPQASPPASPHPQKTESSDIVRITCDECGWTTVVNSGEVDEERRKQILEQHRIDAQHT